MPFHVREFRTARKCDTLVCKFEVRELLYTSKLNTPTLGCLIHGGLNSFGVGTFSKTNTRGVLLTVGIFQIGNQSFVK